MGLSSLFKSKYLIMGLAASALISCKIGDNSLEVGDDGNALQSPSPAAMAVLEINSGPSYDFGQVTAGQVQEHTFTVSNTGQSAATQISEVGLAAPFNFKGGVYPGTGGTCSVTLAPGASCSLVVEFSPVEDAAASDSLEISYRNGASTQTVSRSVSGSGVGIFNKSVAFDLNGDAFGNGHTCGVTSSKNVACWGWNDDGQLGLNDRTNRTKPELVLGGAQGGPLLSDISKVAVGRDNSCAITTTGDVYCWGLGSYNGTGATTTDALTPVRVVTGDQGDVSGFLTGATSISMGYNFTCVATLTGDAYCWGAGGNGRLGSGSTSSSNFPKRVLGGEQGGTYLSNVQSVDVGRATGCAVITTGDLYCWGDRRGAGVGTTGNQTTPVRTLSGEQGGGTYLSQVSKVGVGWNRTCALTTQGNVFCWGDGASSSLGHGVMQNIYTPVKVLGGEQGGTHLENIVDLSYGFGHACAISSTRELYCWGSNQSTLAARMLDAANAPISDASKVTAGPVHSCYTKQNGEVYCWGSNATGQLGSNGSLSYFTTMERVLTDLID